MSEPVPAAEHLTLTAGFSRKINLEQRGGLRYEAAEASIYIQRDIPVGADGETIIQTAREAFTLAKTLVLDELGIDYTLDEESGVVVELMPEKNAAKAVAQKVEEAFGPIPGAEGEDPQGGGYGNVTSIRSAPSARPAAGEKPSKEWMLQDIEENPQDWYDNRDSKRNPKAPDYKHRKNGDWAVWLDQPKSRRA